MRVAFFLFQLSCKKMPDELTTLYRPVGQAELDLIRASDFRAFPPRLPEQPVFYPVLSQDYAAHIARDWNTKDERSGFVGYVLRFKVRNEFLDKYSVQKVGGSEHREYWIPATDLHNSIGTLSERSEIVAEYQR
jgi:hypothetical protein